MKILVFGPNSTIGKELIPLINEWEEVICVHSSECDLRNQYEVQYIIERYRPDCVINLAARVGGIFDNIKYPYEYLVDNIQINTNIIESCRKNGVKNLMCISSTCVYPDKLDDSFYPLKEEYVDLGPPPETNYGYAIAKRTMQKQIEYCNKEYGTNYTYIIPSNLYGYNSHYGESSHFLGKLIHKIFEYNLGKIGRLEMLGGSAGKRQFTFTSDIVSVLFKWVFNGCPIMNCNVATPENLTIKEISEIAVTQCMCHLGTKVIFNDETMVGQIRRDVSCGKLMQIFPRQNFTSLVDGINLVYDRMIND